MNISVDVRLVLAPCSADVGYRRFGDTFWPSHVGGDHDLRVI